AGPIRVAIPPLERTSRRMESRKAARIEILAAAALFSVGGAGIKACGLTSGQIACFRSGVAALFVWLFVREARVGWTWRPWVVGIASAGTVTLFVMANRLPTSADPIFLQSPAPLYILLLGPWLLREPIRARDLTLMGVVGVGMA